MAESKTSADDESLVPTFETIQTGVTMLAGEIVRTQEDQTFWTELSGLAKSTNSYHDFGIATRTLTSPELKDMVSAAGDAMGKATHKPRKKTTKIENAILVCRVIEEKLQLQINVRKCEQKSDSQTTEQRGKFFDANFDGTNVQFTLEGDKVLYQSPVSFGDPTSKREWKIGTGGRQIRANVISRNYRGGTNNKGTHAQTKLHARLSKSPKDTSAVARNRELIKIEVYASLMNCASTKPCIFTKLKRVDSQPDDQSHIGGRYVSIQYLLFHSDRCMLRFGIFTVLHGALLGFASQKDIAKNTKEHALARLETDQLQFQTGSEATRVEGRDVYHVTWKALDDKKSDNSNINKRILFLLWFCQFSRLSALSIESVIGKHGLAFSFVDVWLHRLQRIGINHWNAVF